jgi:hypothetical protein
MFFYMKQNPQNFKETFFTFPDWGANQRPYFGAASPVRNALSSKRH